MSTNETELGSMVKPPDSLTVPGQLEYERTVAEFKAETSPDVVACVGKLSGIIKNRDTLNIAQLGLTAAGKTPAERTRVPISDFDASFNKNKTVKENSKIVADGERILETGHQQLAEEHFVNAESYVSFEDYYNDSTRFPPESTTNTRDQGTVDFINARKGALIEKRVNALRASLANGTMTLEQAQKMIDDPTAIKNNDIKAAYQKALNESPQGLALQREQSLAAATAQREGLLAGATENGVVNYGKLQEGINKLPNLTQLEKVKLTSEFANIADKQNNLNAQTTAEKALIDATDAKKLNEKNIATHEKIKIDKERNIKNLKAALKGVVPGAVAGLALVALFAGGGNVALLLSGGVAGVVAGAGIGVGVSENFDPEMEDLKIRELKSKGNAEMNEAQIALIAAQQRARLAETIRAAKSGDIVALERILNLAIK